MSVVNVWETWREHYIVKTKKCSDCNTGFRRPHYPSCPEFGKLTLAMASCPYCFGVKTHAPACWGVGSLSKDLARAPCAEPGCTEHWAIHILDTFRYGPEWNCGGVPEDQDDELPTFVKTIEPVTIKCECGADSIKAPIHSAYCPKAGP